MVQGSRAAVRKCEQARGATEKPCVPLVAVSEEGRRGWFAVENDDTIVGDLWGRPFASKILNLWKGEALVRGETG